MQQVLNCRAAGEASRLLCNASSLPPSDYKDLEIAPIQKAAWRNKSFEYGTWGGEIRAEFAPQPGEIVAAEHWCSSGFANTDFGFAGQEAWHLSAGSAANPRFP
jgi:ureidoacrylate peracid hydrolase